jgi:hypothetical protein
MYRHVIISCLPSTMSNTHSSKSPLPLSDTLRDLALLRASDVNLSQPLAEASKRSQAQTTTRARQDEDAAEVDASVARSYEFATEARKAIRMLHRGVVDAQGARVERVRAQLEELIEGVRDEAT